MRIFSWNVNGIRAALKKGFSNWIETESPDVVCIQETKANQDQVDADLFPPKGYKAYWNSAERKGYSGVLTLTKKKPKSVTTGMGIKEFDIEGRIIRTEFPKFDLLNVYFPNGTSGEERLDYKIRFYEAFLDHCEDLKKSGKKLIVTGDVNTAHCPIDLTNDKANKKNSGFLPQERAWVDKFIEHGFVDTFRALNPDRVQYSWWAYRFNARARNIGWRIDYFFVTKDLMKNVKDGFIEDQVMGSDHCPIGLDIK
jgi:exodeoxyribonuclease III